jgi:hypothetical protein
LKSEKPKELSLNEQIDIWIAQQMYREAKTWTGSDGRVVLG